MTAPTQKSLGQIAWEVDTEGYGYEWSDVEPQYKADWERIAAAVALQCAQICIDLAADHMRQAQGGDNTGASDYRQEAALECATAIREAISRGAKDNP